MIMQISKGEVMIAGTGRGWLDERESRGGKRSRRRRRRREKTTV